MKQTLKFVGALLGALVGIFYLGAIVSNGFIATRSFDSSQDVMMQHGLVYLATIVGCIIVGWFIGGFLGWLFCRS